jgi:plastocyanin
MRTSKTMMAALLAALTLGLAPGGAASAQETAVRIEIRANAFDRAELTISPGTTVTWINHDDDAHTVTSTANAFRSPGLDTDETYAYTFSRPGTYEYYCTLHPLMTGKVIVRSGS